MATIALVGTLAVPAMARLRVDRVSFFLPGVDQYRNLDWSLGNYGNCKILNYTRINLLVATCKGKVTNLSGRAKVETNLGTEIFDFDDGVWRISTSDIYIVGPQRGVNRANATGVAVHNPNRAPAQSPSS